MKKALLTKILALSFLVALVASCNKYEEGSNFSFISAKGRLANTWTLSSSMYTSSNGSSTTTTGFSAMTVTFTKDGNFDLSYTFWGIDVVRDGNWQFNSDKTSVILTYSDNSDTETWNLIKLKNKELKVTSDDANGSFTFDFTGA